MEMYMVSNLKKDCFKLGGMFYIDRAVAMNSTDLESRDFRRIASLAAVGKDISGEKITDLMTLAGGSFESLMSGKADSLYKKETIGTKDDPISKLQQAEITEKNVFTEFSLVMGDEIIFIPFFGYYRNELFEDSVITYSMIVLKTDNLRIGFLIPEKLLSDYFKIEKKINASKVV